MTIQTILPAVNAILLTTLLLCSLVLQHRESRRINRRLMGARAELQELLRRTASLDFQLQETADAVDQLLDHLDRLSQTSKTQTEMLTGQIRGLSRQLKEVHTALEQLPARDSFHQGLANILSYRPGEGSEAQ